MTSTTWVYWATGCITGVLAFACSDGASNAGDSGETVDSGTTEVGFSSTAEDVGNSTLASSNVETTNAHSSEARANDAGSDSNTEQTVALTEPDTGIEATEAGTCQTQSAVAQLAEGEGDYVVDGDEACAGNQGCMLIDVEGMYLPCGNGGYHCSACNEELCVELYYIEECDGVPPESEAGGTDAGGVEAGSVEAGSVEAGSMDAGDAGP